MKPTALLAAALAVPALAAPVGDKAAAVAPRQGYTTYGDYADATYTTYGDYAGAGTGDDTATGYASYGDYSTTYSEYATYGTYRRAVEWVKSWF